MHWRFYRTAVTTRLHSSMDPANRRATQRDRGWVQVSREAPWEDLGEQKLLPPATFTPRGVGGKSSYRQGCRGRLVPFVIDAETPAAHVNRTSRAPSRFKLRAAVPRHHALSDSVTSSPIQSLSPSCYQDERVPQRWKPATAAEAFGRCPNIDQACDPVGLGFKRTSPLAFQGCYPYGPCLGFGQTFDRMLAEKETVGTPEDSARSLGFAIMRLHLPSPCGFSGESRDCSPPDHRFHTTNLLWLRFQMGHPAQRYSRATATCVPQRKQ